ncbi:MAG TPA: hypothetical protein VFN38_12740, partial [Gemmatimonadaceae bacterium]|nr:hypothetical protein [Gemmatimonadaceae bacterium]
MPRRRTGRRALLVSLFPLAAWTLGCDAPTGPGDSNLLAFGSATSGHLAPGETRRFEIEAPAGQGFVVYMDVTGGTLALEL